MGDHVRWKWLFELICICTVSLTTSYDIGRTYNYKYSTTVSANELLGSTKSRDVVFRVNAQVAATNIWQNPANANDYLFLLQVTLPELLLVPKGGDKNSELKTHNSALDGYTDQVLVAHFVDGLIVGLYADNVQSEFVDLKSGIAGLFQLHLKSIHREETDSSGTCTAVYVVSGKSVVKRKTNCHSAFKDESKSHPNPIYRSDYFYDIYSKYEVTRDNVISAVESVETQTYQAVLVKSAGAVVTSRQKLVLTGDVDGSKLVIKRTMLKDALKGLAKVVGSQVKKTDFHPKSGPVTVPCKNFIDTFNKRRNAFLTGNLANFSSVATFMEILPHSVHCSQEAFNKLLKNPKNIDMMPQLLDILAAANVPASIEAALQFLKLESVTDSIDLPERFLSSLASVPFPQQTTIESLMAVLEQKVQSQKIYETLLLTVGSLTKHYQANLKENDHMVERVVLFFEDKLKECKDHLCKLPFLRAMRQTGLSNFLSTLLRVIREGGKAVSEAILALRALPKTSITDEAKNVLVEVYFQLKVNQDPSARILAAESLLLLDPTSRLIEDLLFSFNRTVSEEMATYVFTKMRDIASRDATFQHKLSDILKNSRIGNYHILAKSGFSVSQVFFIPEITAANVSYDVTAEFLKGGVFKRSVFDTKLSINDDASKLLTFGTFAGGLASFSGSAAADEIEEAEDVTAGLELNVLGVAVRPYTFFTGQGEVMGLVWSGSGSETTPIFQAITRLQDNKHSIYLQNGLKVEFSLLGAVSTDISGSVQVSLWSRSAQSLVTSSFAFLMKSLTRIDHGFIDAKVEVTTASDLALEFVTDSDFSGTPLKSCMLFQHNPFIIKQLVTKIETVPGSARKLRRSIRQKYNVSGRCFALNRRVFEMCSLMTS